MTPLYPSKLTKLQQLEYRFFADAVRQLDWELRRDMWAGMSLPEDWRQILRAPPNPKKVRITLRVDEPVVKFFRRRWSTGYQAEMNRVLRAFLHLVMSRIAEGDDTFAFLIEEANREARPKMGDAEKETGLPYGVFPKE